MVEKIIFYKADEIYIVCLNELRNISRKDSQAEN